MLELFLVAASAFLAATILPVASEALVINAIYDASHSWVALVVLVASFANTLGSIINYWLGMYLSRFRGRRWFYFSDRQIARGRHYFKRFGMWTLLFAWLPVIGDVLTLGAGILRAQFWWFVVLVAIGKTARYLAVVYIALAAQPL